MAKRKGAAGRKVATPRPRPARTKGEVLRLEPPEKSAVTIDPTGALASFRGWRIELGEVQGKDAVRPARWERIVPASSPLGSSTRRSARSGWGVRAPGRFRS